VHDGNQQRTQPATLAAFGVGTDGKLVFARACDDKTDGKTSFGAEWWRYRSAQVATAAIRPSFRGGGLCARAEIGAEIIGGRLRLIGRERRTQEDHLGDSPLPFAL
jgi:hypothetical protein